MFHAVGLKVIDANERYKEGFEKSICFSRVDMVAAQSEEGSLTWR
jgi:hypothetical protein